MVVAVTTSDFVQPEPVEDLDVVGSGLVVRIDLAGFECADGRRRVGAVIDELGPVEISLAAPPFAVLAALVDDLGADVVGNQLERAGADRVLGEVGAGLVEGAVHDQAGIIGEVGDERDIGRGELDLDGVVVDLFDAAVAQLAGLGIDQRAHPGRHRVAFRAFIAPASDIVDDILGDERVSVRPGRVLAQVQHVFGGFVVDVPALEQVGLEGILAGVLNQRLKRLTLCVGDLRPIGRARIFYRLDE